MSSTGSTPELKATDWNNKMTERAVDYCRCCKSENMMMFLPLGAQPPANAFLREDQLGSESVFDLNTHACLDCGLIQIPNRIPDDFFRHYLYIPSASATMHEHFSQLADDIKNKFINNNDDLLVDIGCNDGLLLKASHDLGINTLGIDPAENIVDLAREKGLEIYSEYFNPESALTVVNQYGKARVITTSNTFNHIDDLDGFMEGIRILLDDYGVFIIEVPRAIEYKNKLMFDNIYHEHLSVFSVKSLSDLLSRYNMEIFDLEYIDVQGGSMRVFVRWIIPDAAISGVLEEWLAIEKEIGLTDADMYRNYKADVDKIRDELLALLDELIAQGKKIAGYSAPAKGNTLLNYYGIGTDRLPYLVDKNELKQGLYSPGMHIPVVSPEKIMEDKPDFLLILAWNFADEIMGQQDEYRNNGGKFILPIPEPRIVE